MEAREVAQRLLLLPVLVLVLVLVVEVLLLVLLLVPPLQQLLPPAALHSPASFSEEARSTPAVFAVPPASNP